MAKKPIQERELMTLRLSFDGIDCESIHSADLVLEYSIGGKVINAELLGSMDFPDHVMSLIKGRFAAMEMTVSKYGD